MSDYTKTYKTVQGDMWDGIAYKIYGNEKYMKELIEANYDYIDYAVFPAGIMLIVPEINTTSSETVGLPLWRY